MVLSERSGFFGFILIGWNECKFRTFQILLYYNVSNSIDIKVLRLIVIC